MMIQKRGLLLTIALLWLDNTRGAVVVTQADYRNSNAVKIFVPQFMQKRAPFILAKSILNKIYRAALAPNGGSTPLQEAIGINNVYKALIPYVEERGSRSTQCVTKVDGSGTINQTFLLKDKNKAENQCEITVSISCDNKGVISTVRIIADNINLVCLREGKGAQITFDLPGQSRGECTLSNWPEYPDFYNELLTIVKNANPQWQPPANKLDEFNQIQNWLLATK